MRMRNVFQLKNGRIEYTDYIKAAVLDPKISGLKLNCNGGWDWIDDNYNFIKLLLKRGQISEIHTGQDLLSKEDYLDAAYMGAQRSYSISIHFEFRENTKKAAYASKKRINIAKEKFQQFKERKAAMVKTEQEGA